jgi:hypothetical protein
MTFTYVVRCNFSDPRREQAWNDWYSGPKLAQMLAKPMFRTVQRFKRTAGEGRNYLALWTLDSPEAFNTKEYTSDWGFFEWKPYIIDWSRDLFEGSIAPDKLEVAADGKLTVVSFDHMPADKAEAAREAGLAKHPEGTCLRSVGLDRHTPWIILDTRGTGALSSSDIPGGAQEDVYGPISAFCKAASVTR